MGHDAVATCGECLTGFVDCFKSAPVRSVSARTMYDCVRQVGAGNGTLRAVAGTGDILDYIFGF